MKTVSINVYKYQELSDKAKIKALNQWNEEQDLGFIQSMLQDVCGGLLKDHGITCTSNYPTVLYSLSNCQGDGVMFEGSFEYKGHSIVVKHSGHYYHSNSKTVDITDENGEEADIMKYQTFEAIYQGVCKKLEKLGYQLIEDEQSEAHFIDGCNENEWTFEASGVMRNA